MVLPRRQGPFQVSPIAGQKRSAPALLPAFEPISSSPKLPRLNREVANASNSPPHNFLPSAPTSSTFVPTSPPSQTSRTRRSGLQRTISSLSERTPLATLPSFTLHGDGKPTFMGRSSTSSHHQLSTNKLISRIHIRAVFVPAHAATPNQIQVTCTGWNGVKIHCQGKAWNLYKGDTFTSETEDAEILIDVHDSRVLLKWPNRHSPRVLTPTNSESSSDCEDSPSGLALPLDPLRGPRVGITSPVLTQSRPCSLNSPIQRLSSGSGKGVRNTAASRSIPHSPLKIFEDGRTDVEESFASDRRRSVGPAGSPISRHDKDHMSTRSPFHESDEENDPIIHSFGPCGEDLTGRLESLGSSKSPGPRQPLQPLSEEKISPQRQRVARATAGSHSREGNVISASEILGHSHQDLSENTVHFAINHLMYSQLSATPLSLLFQHIQTHLNAGKGGDGTSPALHILTSEKLELMLDCLPCVGSVQREGKDAAGKRLESEYYYIPEQDEDESRREAVKSLGIGGRGLRSCRKNHKVGLCVQNESKSPDSHDTPAILLAKAQIGQSIFVEGHDSTFAMSNLAGSRVAHSELPIASTRGEEFAPEFDPAVDQVYRGAHAVKVVQATDGHPTSQAWNCMAGNWV